MKETLFSFVSILFLTVSCLESDIAIETGKDWPRYGGNNAGNRYSPLDQINRENVKDLKVAWMYDASEPVDTNDMRPQRIKQIQTQPIVVHGILYGLTAELKLFALNARTGEQLWRFEPEKVKEQGFSTNRGVMYWESGDEKRILYTVGSFLFAVNASTGDAIKSFGDNGKVSLHEGLQEGLDNDISTLSVSASTPGVIYKNTLVIGSAVSEAGDAAPGYIRAFDVISGKLKWVFRTIPHPGEFGYDTWPENAYQEIGGVNSWSGMVLDDKRGVVYMGTGSPSSDFYGGNREGANLFANCILALDAETGKMKWYYQTIHHDLWDRDHPTPPNLTTVNYNGRMVDVVVQATKDGLVYVLNRDDGTSLFPVEERSVPTNGLPGEHVWPTQKYPLKPLPFSRQMFTEDEITNISPESHAFVKEKYLKYRSDDKFTPPSVEGTILFGYSGGAEWGGNSIDPNGILYQNSNDDPWVLQMIDTTTVNKEVASVSKGNAIYIQNCAVCHGQDRKGNGTQFPSLINIGTRLSFNEISSVIKSGSGRMPSFPQISEEDRADIVDFLLNPRISRNVVEHGIEPEKEENDKRSFGFKPAYVAKVWRKLNDQNGYPGVKPPWGTLNALDLNTGEYLWRVPLGEFPELTAKGIPVTGTENYGGPISTAGGLIFIAGTKDERIRAFDKETGQVLWEFQLPAGGFATPITYEVDGKQFVVIAVGGARGQRPGGNYVAFSLENLH